MLRVAVAFVIAGSMAVLAQLPQTVNILPPVFTQPLKASQVAIEETPTQNITTYLVSDVFNGYEVTVFDGKFTWGVRNIQTVNGAVE